PTVPAGRLPPSARGPASTIPFFELAAAGSDFVKTCVCDALLLCRSAAGFANCGLFVVSRWSGRDALVVEGGKAFELTHYRARATQRTLISTRPGAGSILTMKAASGAPGAKNAQRLRGQSMAMAVSCSRPSPRP